MFQLFADPQIPMAKQVDAYAHRNSWVNRMILKGGSQQSAVVELVIPRFFKRVSGFG
jgi:hypothetical protein